MRLDGLRVGIVWIVLVGWFAALQAIGAPLDLGDETPRWIEVRFEISPHDEPGSLDRHWSVTRRARIEPRTAEGVLRIRIPAVEIEAQLRSTGTDTIPGSFSEFVWTLDPKTGHVVNAGLTGRVREQIRLGPFRSSAKVDIRVEMNTTRDAGFEPGHGILGVRTNRFCSPSRGQRTECVAVAPVIFDPRRGYVNAVGTIRAASNLAQLRAFSPLGEVKFSERASRGTESVVSGPMRADALCSAAFDGPCWLDLGGEL